MKKDIPNHNGWKYEDQEFGVAVCKGAGMSSHVLRYPNFYGKVAMILAKNKDKNQELMLCKSKGRTQNGYILNDYVMTIDRPSNYGVFSKLSQEDWAFYCHSNMIPAINEDRKLGFSWHVNEEPYKTVILPAIISNVRTDTYSEDYSTMQVPTLLYDKFEDALKNKSSNRDFQFISNVVNNIFKDYKLKNRIEFTLLGMVLVNSVMDKTIIQSARDVLGVNKHKLDNYVDSLWLSQNQELWSKLRFFPTKQTASFQAALLVLTMLFEWEVFLFFAIFLWVVHNLVHRKSIFINFVEIFQILLGVKSLVVVAYIALLIIGSFMWAERYKPPKRLHKLSITENSLGAGAYSLKNSDVVPEERQADFSRLRNDTERYIASEIELQHLPANAPHLQEARGKQLPKTAPPLFSQGWDRTHEMVNISTDRLV